MAEQVLEEDLQRDGRAGHVQPVADGVEAEVRVAVVTDLQARAPRGSIVGCRDAIEHASFVNRAVRGQVGAGRVRLSRVEIEGEYSSR